MTASPDFKLLAERRLRTVELLISHEEWVVAAYMMGFVLECVLKAAICKVLHLESYPEPGPGVRHEVSTYFMTHNFDQLLIVSGMSDLFRLYGKGANTRASFIQEYPGSWTDIRYKTAMTEFDKEKVALLYKLLNDSPDVVLLR
jgi:hypothetical protein